MTQRDFLEMVIAGTIGEAEVAYAKERLAKLDAKNEYKRNTLTDKQEQNEGLKIVIVEVIKQAGGVMTAGAIAKELKINVQKANALLGQLVKAGEIIGARPKASKPIEYRLPEAV